MKKICTYLFLLLLTHLLTYSLTHCLFAVDNIDREKLTLETNIEKRIADSLSKLLSPQDFIIIIKIEPIVEEITKSKPREKLQIEQLSPEIKKTPKEYILPGVPTKKNILEEEKVSQAPVQVIVPPAEKEIEILKQFIKKITVTVKFDKNVPDNVIAEARKIITGLVDFNTVRGDQLIIEKTEFYKKKIPWWSVATTFPSMMWYLSIILFAFFLFGPLNVFFKHLLRTLSSKPASQQPIDNFLTRPSSAAAAGQGGGIGSLTMALDDGKSGRPKLFAFINDGNLRNLAYLLKDESPDRTALVLSYLRNDWASYVLSQLPSDLQSRVAVELANVKQLEPDDVEIMELELKKKIDYLIGGSAQIIELCERSDKKTCENILSALAINNSELAEQVRVQLLSIDDLYFIDTAGLRTLFREIPLPTWAIGLKNAKDSTREAVLKTLPPGAAEMLKQEIDLNMAVPQVRINEEEKRIIMTMRKLRNDGRITIIKGEISRPESEPEKSVSISQPTEPSATVTTRAKDRTETREERLAKIKERLKKERGG
ncbi:MAG: hypothetical protein HY919_09120 [Elusimicrobia bacterium]|nr:hypothetical protein [Elusimicrobiota bacterium]